MTPSSKVPNDLLDENEELRARIVELETGQRGAGDHATTLAEILPDTVWESDAQGLLKYVNEAGLENFGFSPQDLLNGVNILDLIAPEDRERAQESVGRRLQGDDLGLTEYMAVRKDGSTFPMLVRSLRIVEDEETVGFLGLVIDISKQKEVENSLRDSEARLSQSQQTAGLGSWQLNPEAGEVWWSHQHYTLLGLDEESHSPNWENVQALVHPEDLDAFRDAGERALQNHAPATAEVRMRHSAGHFIDVRVHARWTEQGILVGTVQDVTEQNRAATALRESEEKYRTLVNVSPDAIAIHTDGIIRYVNPAGLQMFGVQDLESIVGRSTLDFVHPSLHESAMERLGVLQAGGTVPAIEELFQRADGTAFWAESTARPFRFEGERSVLVIVRDVTTRRELEGRLRQTEKLEALGTLAGGVAHDFNNILHVLLGSCSVALEQRETNQNPTLQDSLQQIQKCGHRASDLVRQILSFSRAGSGDAERIRIQPVVHDALDFLRKSLPSSIEILSDIEPDALHVLADSTQIYQLLLNICTNSSQAIGEEHGQLTVRLYAGRGATSADSATQDSDDGEVIWISIEDTGSGMDEVTLERVFEPFFTTKPVGTGTGLGLSIVHGIVDSLGGSIRITSQLGEGTTVLIGLPVCDEAVESRSPIAEREGPRIPSGLRVLFVDDEPMIVDLGVTVLEGYGLAVQGFTDPEAALDAFRAEPEGFDIVICDLTMPKVTGLELASCVGEINPKIPVLLCSGNAAAAAADAARIPAIRERLQKPIRFERMLESILRHVG